MLLKSSTSSLATTHRLARGRELHTTTTSKWTACATTMPPGFILILSLKRPKFPDASPFGKAFASSRSWTSLFVAPFVFKNVSAFHYETRVGQFLHVFQW